jgi:hypothetical protein
MEVVGQVVNECGVDVLLVVGCVISSGPSWVTRAPFRQRSRGLQRLARVPLPSATVYHDRDCDDDHGGGKAGS